MSLDNGSLFDAIQLDDSKRVQELISKGANIEEKDEYGDTPLIDAAFTGKKESLRVLIDNKANIEARGAFDSTALLRAAERGHSECVEELLKHGADIPAQPEWSVFGTLYVQYIHCTVCVPIDWSVSFHALFQGHSLNNYF